MVLDTERVAELDALVKDLEEQLAEQEETANSVIEQWQESCTALEERNKELMQSPEEAGETKEREGINGHEGNSKTLTTLLAELEETKAAFAEAQAKLEDDDNVVVKWEGKNSLVLCFLAGQVSKTQSSPSSMLERVAGLESAVKDMELQLSEQEESANTVITKWQESCNALEEKNSELLSRMESFGPGEDEMVSREALLALEHRLQETEAALVLAKENLKDDDDVVLKWQGER